MKQNGVRLVQRKFAQGVPIPASSSSIAPTPPERKSETPYPPKNVYHNNMSARSLLDIVAMQNIHKHKQEPLVVLERLRVDEIPSPLPKVRRLRKRRVKANKNNMCLRSGKRNSTDAAKAVARKRKKLSSESTDDVPLMYYFNRPQAKAHKPMDTDKKDRSLDKEKRTLPPKRRQRVGTLVSEKSASTRAETIKKSDDRSFTFKEPTNPARLSYRLFKKKAAAKAVRTLKKNGLPLNGRWSTLRSARGSEPRLARPLRTAVVLGKKPSKPAVRKGSRIVNKDASLNPSSTSTTVDVVNPRSSPTLGFDFDGESSSGQQDWCVIENANIKSEIMKMNVMTILRTPNRTPSITEVTTKVDRNILEQKLMSEAPKLGERSVNTKEKCNAEEFSENKAKEKGKKAKDCNSKVCTGDKGKVKEKGNSKINKDNEKGDNEPTNSNAKKSQASNLYAEKIQTNNLDAVKKYMTNLDVIKRQTNNLDAEKTNNLDAVKRQSNNLDAVKKQSNHLDAEKRKTNNLDAVKRETNNLDAEKRQTNNVDAVKRQTTNLDAEKRLTNNLDAVKRQTTNLDAVKRQTANLDVVKRQTNNLDVVKRQTTNLDVVKRQTNNLDVVKRQTNNLDADKRKTDNLDAEKRQANIQENENTNKDVNVASMETDVENREERQCAQESQKRGEKKKGVRAKTITKMTVAENATKEKNNSKKLVTKALKETKKTKPKCGSKSVPEETATSTRLLRNSREPQPPPNPDVYEFDAELEASRPPSSLRRRSQAPDVAQPTPEPAPAQADPAQPAQTPTSPDSVEYLDILPRSSHCIQITPKKQQETGAECPSVKLVPKEEISIKKKKNLIENLSNSPALLNKFFNCLPAELQNELDNLIAAEGLNEASTSKEETYLDQKTGSVYEAPTFYPTAEEFEDPIKYYDKIAPQASKYGLCKIVPPDHFKPPCNMSDTIRFAVIYQYISKMYSRWGPVSRELAAIKAHLRTQSVVFARSPLLDGSEVNLPKLYHAVERNGGLSNVIQRKRWGRVADEMKLTKLQHPERKLDPIYMRYLLPYATLSDQERQNIMAEVEKCWTTKYQKMLERARNPFQRQNRMLGTECESESDDDSEDGNTAGALHEAEDCIVQGRTMNLVTFKKIATSLMDAHFEPSKQPPTALDVEKAYWRAVLLGTEHIVANTASIDTGEEGYGFPKDPEAEYGTHPWNLKVLARNPNNVLRYLGPVLGVTVPTLHLSMLFSTSCWHRDPHGLPWTEYMHSGADKIWYGIPRDESANFRRAVETLCPAYCQNKSIWLASEITMVPPNILSEHGVKLSRLLQRPGEYVLVFPEAHSCSITTGFGISESVYFASNAWLSDVYKLFQELRNSCEPTMFSLEQLLLNGSSDTSAPQQVCSVLCTLLSAELEHRRALEQKGLKVQERPASSAPLNTSYFRAWNTRDQDECEYCRSTLFLSKVTGLTGRKSAVCPEHALRLLETKKYKNTELSTLEFISSYSTSALEEMLERLESRTSEQASSRAPSVIDLTGPERAESREYDTPFVITG